MIASLDRKPALVVGMRAPDDEPHVIVGSNVASPYGPVVCIGAAMSLDNGPGLALVAHLSFQDARELVERLTVAAAEVERAAGQGGRA